MYDYRATVVRVLDGDTVEAQVDLGFRIVQTMMIRLVGINAPELHGATKAAGDAAKTHLTELVANKSIVVHTQLDKTEKYGRVLGTLIDGDVNVNEKMVADGHAAPYMVTKS